MTIDNDEFATAFAEIAALGDKEPTPPTAADLAVANGAAETSTDPAAAVVPETPIPENPDEPANPEPEPVAAAADADPEPEPASEPAPRQNDDDILARFAQIVAQQKPEPAAQPAPQPAPQPQQTPQFTPDELKALQDYEKDWPDVARAESLKRRAEYQQLIGYVFSELASVLNPVVQQVRGGAESTHLNDLYARVPDYDQVRDPVIDWVAKQPAYLKNAYGQVVQQGTPEEIADLVNRWRAENAPAQPQAAPQPKAPNPAVKKAAAAMAPVSTKRSGAVSMEPTDFDSAFDQFAKGA